MAWLGINHFPVSRLSRFFVRLRLAAIGGFFELNLPQPHLKFNLFRGPPVADVCSMPSDIYPCAVDDVWPHLRIFGLWFTHVPVLAVFEVEILAAGLTETLMMPYRSMQAISLA